MADELEETLKVRHQGWDAQCNAEAYSGLTALLDAAADFEKPKDSDFTVATTAFYENWTDATFVVKAPTRLGPEAADLFFMQLAGGLAKAMSDSDVAHPPLTPEFADSVIALKERVHSERREFADRVMTWAGFKMAGSLIEEGLGTQAIAFVQRHSTAEVAPRMRWALDYSVWLAFPMHPYVAVQAATNRRIATAIRARRAPAGYVDPSDDVAALELGSVSRMTRLVGECDQWNRQILGRADPGLLARADVALEEVRDGRLYLAAEGMRFDVSIGFQEPVAAALVQGRERLDHSFEVGQRVSVELGRSGFGLP